MPLRKPGSNTIFSPVFAPVYTPVGGVGGAAVSPAGADQLDSISPTALAAWGTIRMTATFSGNIVRVRRADTTESDIAMDADARMDDAALETFAGGTQTTAVTLFDQIGSKDATQGTASLQPDITDGSGNSLGYIQGANDSFLKYTGDVGVTGFPHSAICWVRTTAAATDQVYLEPSRGSANYFGVANNGSAGWSFLDGPVSEPFEQIIGDATTGSVWELHATDITATTVSNSVNGAAYNTDTFSTQTFLGYTNGTFIGQHNQNNLRFIGKLTGIAVFDEAMPIADLASTYADFNPAA